VSATEAPVEGTGADATGPAIELHDVEKRFGDVVAVQPLSLQIERGEFFSLLGPSGCGKTTTLRMLAGFEYPDSGTVSLHGRDVTFLAPNKRPVNLVFQRYELFPHMSVRQNVGYGLRVKKVPKKEIAQRVDEMLEIVGVGDLGGRRADALSGGQQQRVALARALVNRPEVLLLDEPLSALDVKLRKHMQLELKSIQQELGTTFVYVTHDQEEAMVLSDRIGIMSDGRLLQVGTPEEIYEAPSDPFVADFVGTSNELEVEVTRTMESSSLAHHDDVTVVVPGAFAAGSRLKVAVRPERIVVRSASGAGGGTNGAEPAAGGVTSVPGAVVEAIYLGPTLQHVVETPLGQVLTLEPAGSADRREVGSEVLLSWATEALLVLEVTPPDEAEQLDEPLAPADPTVVPEAAS
jgi:spermidine/putrescine transport system ATP-binding protein